MLVAQCELQTDCRFWKRMFTLLSYVLRNLCHGCERAEALATGRQSFMPAATGVAAELTGIVSVDRSRVEIEFRTRCAHCRSLVQKAG